MPFSYFIRERIEVDGLLSSVECSSWDWVSVVRVCGM
jgi:hypothetical protein